MPQAIACANLVFHAIEMVLHVCLRETEAIGDFLFLRPSAINGITVVRGASIPAAGVRLALDRAFSTDLPFFF